jgi:hypothetical protein
VGGALTDAVWIFAVVLVLIILAAVALASRRYLLERSGGTVECALRCPPGSGAWRLGVLSYQHDSLRWHGALGVLLRPEYVFHRRALSVVSRRPAEPAEAVTLGADRIVVEVSADPAAGDSGPVPGEHVELAMTEQALTGFLAWLEASPPGSHLGDLTLPVSAWVPQDVPAARVRRSGEDEQQVGEPVQVLGRPRAHRGTVVGYRGPRRALRPSGHGPCRVQQGRAGGASR